MTAIIVILTAIVSFLLGYWVCATYVRIQLAKTNEENMKKIRPLYENLDELEKLVKNGG